MHNHNIDEVVYNSRMLNWSPLGKFILVIFLLVASLLADSLVVPIVVFVIGASLLFYSTNFKIPSAFKFIASIAFSKLGFPLLST